MEQQLNLGSLLSAAGLLDLNKIATSETLSQNLFDLTNENELRSLFCGKLKIDKKSLYGTASTSTSTPSTHPYCTSPPPRKTSKHSRAAHNELEKTRRANLRGCLEQLKNLVPAFTDAARNTTLALLTRARDHILELEESNNILQQEKKNKEQENAQLLAELAQLQQEDESEQSQESTSTSRPESRASSTCSQDSPYFLEYSPSSKPSMSDSPKPILIDAMAEGLLPAVPITYPRPYVYPHNVIDLINLQSSSPNFDVSAFLPINLRV